MPTRVFVPFLRKEYNHNPKGSATVEVTMAQNLPWDRPISITKAGNVPVTGPTQYLRGPSDSALSHTRAMRAHRPPIVSAAVSGLGADAPAAPATSWSDALNKAGQTVAQAGAEKLASKINKAPKKAAPKMPKFIANVPKTNWVIVGVAGAVALTGVVLLMKGKGGRRRR